MRLLIPVFYNTEESAQKEKLGMEITDDDITISQMIFYSVDALGDLMEQNVVTGCVIVSGGDSFQSPWKKERIDRMITNYKENPTEI